MPTGPLSDSVCSVVLSARTAAYVRGEMRP
jgi:hypothetical protein